MSQQASMSDIVQALTAAGYCRIGDGKHADVTMQRRIKDEVFGCLGKDNRLCFEAYVYSVFGPPSFTLAIQAEFKTGAWAELQIYGIRDPKKLAEHEHDLLKAWRAVRLAE